MKDKELERIDELTQRSVTELSRLELEELVRLQRERLRELHLQIQRMYEGEEPLGWGIQT